VTQLAERFAQLTQRDTELAARIEDIRRAACALLAVVIRIL
jgi:hypothetical protein